MLALLKKELRSLFLSPLAYVVIGGFTFLSAFSFLSATLASGTSDVTGFFSGLVLFIIIIVSILSMKIFSEEKKSKTKKGNLSRKKGEQLKRRKRIFFRKTKEKRKHKGFVCQRIEIDSNQAFYSKQSSQPSI